MKLKLTNIGCFEHKEIAMDPVCVIRTGQGGTTLCKALFSLTSVACDIYQSVRKIKNQYLADRYGTQDGGYAFFDRTVISDQELANELANQSVLCTFGACPLHNGADGACIELQDETGFFSCSVTLGAETELVIDIIPQRPHVIVSGDNVAFLNRTPRDHFANIGPYAGDSLNAMLDRSVHNVFDQINIRKKCSSIIDDIKWMLGGTVAGRLGDMRLLKGDGADIPLESLSSFEKLLVTFYRMLEMCCFNEKDILILDCAERGLDDERAEKVGKLVSRIRKALDLRVLAVTCNEMFAKQLQEQ